MKKLFILLLLFMLPSTPLLAKQLHSESYYQEIFCTQKNGQSEVTMEDRTRCDCIFEEDGIEYATEVDFAKKKYQAVGQALHYSRMTGKKPAILLIIEESKDCKYLNSMVSDIQYHNLDIKVFVIFPPEYNSLYRMWFNFIEKGELVNVID